MPIYDYKCNNCGYEFEKQISYKDIDTIIVKCNSCKSTETRRKISGKPFVKYIGDGFTQAIDRLTDE